MWATSTVSFSIVVVKLALIRTYKQHKQWILPYLYFRQFYGPFSRVIGFSSTSSHLFCYVKAPLKDNILESNA